MRLLAWVRSFAHSIAAGALAGLLAGAGARLAMRIATFLSEPTRIGVRTNEDGIVGAFTWEGTVSVLVIGMLVGVSGGALHALARPILPASARGLAFGALALALFGWTILDPANSDFRAFGSPALNYATFAALFLLFGVAIVRLERWLDAGTSRAAWSYTIWIPLALVGAGLALLNTVFGTDRHPTWGFAAIALLGSLVSLQLLTRRRGGTEAASSGFKPSP